MPDEGTITIVVRPTSRGTDERFSVSIEQSASVLELKTRISEKSPLKAEEQRLIFKGKILKDEKLIEEYGEALGKGPPV